MRYDKKITLNWTDSMVQTLSRILTHNPIKFGTSGVRGLNSQLTDQVCYLFTLAFLHYLKKIREIKARSRVILAGDLRPTTNHILQVIAQAITAAGYPVEYIGKLPTPALSHYCLQKNTPGIMVTGSHIPANMNGLKFYKATGEILKQDEKNILLQPFNLPNGLFKRNGQLKKLNRALPLLQMEAHTLFVKRYIDFFPKNGLSTMKIGIYQHSSVTYPILKEILLGLGAEVISFGASKKFHSVDTESLTAKDISLAKKNIKKYRLDAIVSTDGDGDRPLVSDRKGQWIRGDLLGLLCALFLKAYYLAIPVSCNESIRRIKRFKKVALTKIGSPYVIEQMNQLQQKYRSNILGFEANGGTLLGSDFRIGKKTLSALPTRDSVIAILSALYYLRDKKFSLKQFRKKFKLTYTTSSSIKNVANEKINELLGMLETSPDQIIKILKIRKKVKETDSLDGLKIYFVDQTILHLRGSGNASELRCYTEAHTQAAADRFNQRCQLTLSQWIKHNAK